MTGPGRTRTPARVQFLADVLATAIESSGYGAFTCTEWHCPDGGEAEWFALLTWPAGSPPTTTLGSEPGQTHRVDIETMARGLGIIAGAVAREDPRYPADGPVPHNAATGQRLYFGGKTRDALNLANRTNGDDGDIDVVGALAVLECAHFGCVVYA